jgi:glyoxylase-like metal-dependent hydrolase (beta-lactamase superfamily II)
LVCQVGELSEPSLVFTSLKRTRHSTSEIQRETSYNMEAAKGIDLIPAIRGANSYLIHSQDEAMIVDTGMPGNETRILDYAKSLGIEPSSISTIILTHPDIDHAGSVAKQKAQTNAKVAIHEADAPRLSGEKKLKEVKGALGLVLKVMGVFIRFNPVTPDVLLKDSDKIDGVTIIHTPGHTEGSVSVYIPGEALLVGDALRTTRFESLRLPAMTLDMERAKESIKRISELTYTCLLPGHGPPIKHDASTKVKQFVDNQFHEL